MAGGVLGNGATPVIRSCGNIPANIGDRHPEEKLAKTHLTNHNHHAIPWRWVASIPAAHLMGLDHRGVRRQITIPPCLLLLALAPEDVWRTYNGRADTENRLKELKHAFGADGFCSQRFWATEAALRAICLLYNLIEEFQWTLGRPPDGRWRPSGSRCSPAAPSWAGPAGRRCCGSPARSPGKSGSSLNSPGS
jgi:hypothetical protein